MISSICLAGLMFSTGVDAANTMRIFTLSADEWARPRSGDIIPEMESVRAAVSYWGRGVDALVIIRHPGEDSGELWAAELRDWLISLGVPSDYIRLIPGTQAADEIRLVVGNRDELEQ
ncbi:MAG: hypothetical protein JSU67_01380 [Gammaproteobacteria bacterium]|nr:MAG: hypothetical protein JSU67_01380 [Gammaproteobacteria bacterium]